MNTLNSYHKNKIKEIHKQEKINKKIQKKIKVLQKEIDEMDNKGMSKMTDEEIQKYFQIKNDIETEGKSLKDIREEEINYYFEAMDCLCDYFEITNTHDSNSTQNLFDFNDSNIENVQSFITENKGENKKDIFNKYLEIVEDDYIGNIEYTIDYTICKFCNTNMKLNQNHSSYLCETCGYVNTIVLLSEKKKYNTYSTEQVNVSYKRIRIIRWNTNRKTPVRCLSR